LKLAYDDQRQDEANMPERDDQSKNGNNEDLDGGEEELAGVYIKAFCSGVNEVLTDWAWIFERQISDYLKFTAKAGYLSPDVPSFDYVDVRDRGVKS
jgi:hypothetical protein